MTSLPTQSHGVNVTSGFVTIPLITLICFGIFFLFFERGFNSCGRPETQQPINDSYANEAVAFTKPEKQTNKQTNKQK